MHRCNAGACRLCTVSTQRSMRCRLPPKLPLPANGCVAVGLFSNLINARYTMKHITIPINQVGLVFKNGQLVRVLTTGQYWVAFSTVVEVYDMSAIFLPKHDLNVLLQHAGLAELLDVVEVADSEIALLYKDGNFRQVLVTGKYAFWKGATVHTTIKANMRTIHIDDQIDKNLIDRGALYPNIRMFKVDTFEQGVLFVNGVMTRTLTGGTYYFWKNSDTMDLVKADMRQMTIDIGGQEVLTKDKAQLRINFTVQFRVVDLVKALVENKDFDKQLYTQMQMALREIVGKLTFDELMESKEQVAAQVMANAIEKARELGVQLAGFGIKDIILPGEIKDIMNQVLVAEKRAQANVIMRREETASTRSLMNTAKLMEENAMLFKLKEMEYVEKIAEKIHTITLSGGGQIVDQLKQLFVK